MGDIRNDYYAGAPDLACIGRIGSTEPGYGPDKNRDALDVATSGWWNPGSSRRSPVCRPRCRRSTRRAAALNTCRSQDQDAQRRVRRERRLRKRWAAGCVGLSIDLTDIALGEKQIWQIRPEARTRSTGICERKSSSGKHGSSIRRPSRPASRSFRNARRLIL